MKIMNLIKFVLLFSIITLFLSPAGCVFSPFNAKFDAGHFLTSSPNIPDNSSQIILVKESGFWIFSRTTVYAMGKKENHWSMVFDPMMAVIGRNGFAETGAKREGDGKTPSGIYPLKTTFGYHESVTTKMPYRQALGDDVWVDDPLSEDYNRWTKKSTTKATSYEMMKRDDELYKYGVVIEYNTDPVIKGNGSAIFLHIWQGKGIPTAGCVAVSETDIAKIIEWLDPAAAPLMITGIKN